MLRACARGRVTPLGAAAQWCPYTGIARSTRHAPPIRTANSSANPSTNATSGASAGRSSRTARARPRPNWLQDPLRHNLSFSGAGFMGIYHLGVASRLHELGLIQQPEEAKELLAEDKLGEVMLFAGASAGCIISAVLVCGLRPADLFDRFMDSVRTVRGQTFGAFTPGVHLVEVVRDHLDELLPADAHLLANRRLLVSLTDWEPGSKRRQQPAAGKGAASSTDDSSLATAENVRSVPHSDRGVAEEAEAMAEASRRGALSNRMVSRFATREVLLQAIERSCLVPGFSGSLTAFRTPPIDGGFTNNFPSTPGPRPTCFISPLRGNFDICPPPEAGWPRVSWMTHEIELCPANGAMLRKMFIAPDDDELISIFHSAKKDTDTCLRRLYKDHA